MCKNNFRGILRSKTQKVWSSTGQSDFRPSRIGPHTELNPASAMGVIEEGSNR